MRKRVLRKFKRISFKLNYKIIGWTICSILIIIILFGSFKLLFIYGKEILYSLSVFKIEKIKTNIELEEKLKRKIIGGSLLTLNVKEIHYQLTLMYPQYKEIIILKELPSTLKIEAKIKKPFAQFKSIKYYLIDRDATVIEEGGYEPFSFFIPIEISDYKGVLKKGSIVND
ncbi:MAG: hypothetical protein QXZ20_01530, partial [Candidatus Aenigmatarchaeota archaeon]